MSKDKISSTEIETVIPDYLNQSVFVKHTLLDDYLSKYNTRIDLVPLSCQLPTCEPFSFSSKLVDYSSLPNLDISTTKSSGLLGCMGECSAASAANWVSLSSSTSNQALNSNLSFIGVSKPAIETTQASVFGGIGLFNDLYTAKVDNQFKSFETLERHVLDSRVVLNSISLSQQPIASTLLSSLNEQSYIRPAIESRASSSILNINRVDDFYNSSSLKSPVSAWHEQSNDFSVNRITVAYEDVTLNSSILNQFSVLNNPSTPLYRLSLSSDILNKPMHLYSIDESYLSATSSDIISRTSIDLNMVSSNLINPYIPIPSNKATQDYKSKKISKEPYKKILSVELERREFYDKSSKNKIALINIEGITDCFFSIVPDYTGDTTTLVDIIINLSESSAKKAISNEKAKEAQCKNLDERTWVEAQLTTALNSPNFNGFLQKNKNYLFNKDKFSRDYANLVNKNFPEYVKGKNARDINPNTIRRWINAYLKENPHNLICPIQS